MFWVGILVMVAIVIGASVLVGRMLNNQSGGRSARGDKVMALKASGALRHRKSNRE